MAPSLFIPRQFPAALHRLGLSVGLLLVLPITALAQEAPQAAQGSDAPLEQARPESAGAFNITTARRLLTAADEAILAQNYAVATSRLVQARTTLSQLAENYSSLSTVFSGIDTRLRNSNRQQALEAAQLRDEVTYKLAVLYQVQEQPEQAIPLLIEVVNSQQPTRELGEQAISQLCDIGFIDCAEETSPSGSYNVSAGQRLVAEAEGAIAAQNYAAALEQLGQARTLFNELSDHYRELSEVFIGIDPEISEASRQDAIDAAQLRDETSYQMALIHRAQGNPEQSIPLLVEVVRSQQPTRPLGQQAYQQLFEIGFVTDQFTIRTPQANR